MKKKLIVLTMLILGVTSLHADTCSDGLKFNFTFFGGANKEYVVTKNTFNTYKSSFPAGKLQNATLDIDAFSIETKADMNNINAKWPASMATLRNNNTKNNFFKKFTKNAGKINVKVVKVGSADMTLAFSMNGVTKNIPFTYSVSNGTINAKGKLNVLDFKTDTAWKAFSMICKGFHHGKSWETIDIFFSVPASCK